MNLLLSTTDVVDNAAFVHGVNISNLEGRKTKRNHYQSQNKENKFQSESIFTNLPHLSLKRSPSKPSLKFRNAIHVKNITTNNNNNNKQEPDYGLVKKFNSNNQHQFRQSVDIVIKSFTNSKSQFILNQTDFVPLDIINLCQKYLYSKDDEIMALGLTLYKSLKQLKRKCITKKMLYLLIKHYLSTNKLNKDSNNIKKYIKRLLELKYITNKKIGAQNVYRIPMDKELLFSTM